MTAANVNIKWWRRGTVGGADITFALPFECFPTRPQGNHMNHMDQVSDRKPATRLLDFRFNYIPAAATDIAATWKRFGFDPRANQQRRELFRNSFSGTASELTATTIG